MTLQRDPGRLRLSQSASLEPDGLLPCLRWCDNPTLLVLAVDDPPSLSKGCCPSGPQVGGIEVEDTNYSLSLAQPE